MKNRIAFYYPELWQQYLAEQSRRELEGKPLPAGCCLPKEFQSPSPISNSDITHLVVEDIIKRSLARDRRRTTRRTKRKTTHKDL